MVGAMWGYAAVVLGGGVGSGADRGADPSRHGGATYLLLGAGVVREPGPEKTRR